MMSIESKNYVANQIVRFGELLLYFGMNLAYRWDSPRKIFVSTILERNWNYQKFRNDFKLVNSSDICIVIVGAHFGETAEKYLGWFSESQVIAYEPNLRSLQIAVEKLSIYGNRVNLIGKAVGSTSGTAKLNTYQDSGADSLKILLSEEKLDSMNCEVTTLDQELENVGKVDLLQIDCQGFEMEVILGMEKLIVEKRIDAILIEGLLDNFYENQSSFWELAAELSKSHRFCGFPSMKFGEGQKPNLLWVDALFVRKELLS